MNARSLSGVVAASTLALLVPLPAAAQAGRAAAPAADSTAKKYTVSRTPWGDPDLQGVYSNRTITPFERPANVNGREFFTKEEVAGLESRAQQQSGDQNRNKGTDADV